MKEFTASNGLKIAPSDQGAYVILSEIGDNMLEDMPWIGFEDDKALAEYYRAKEDERLGRWRWPENPDIYVRPMKGNPDVFGVVKDNEDGLAYGQYSRADRRLLYGTDPMGQAARAYFDAHPEPKPWHEAVEGEVWELEFKAGAHAWFVNGAYFQSTKTLTNIRKDDPDILSGSKIYPQGDK